MTPGVAWAVLVPTVGSVPWRLLTELVECRLHDVDQYGLPALSSQGLGALCGRPGRSLLMGVWANPYFADTFRLANISCMRVHVPLGFSVAHGMMKSDHEGQPQLSRLRHAAALTGQAMGLAVIVLALAGCNLFGPFRPARIHTPEIIGPIDDIRNVPGNLNAHEAVVGDDVIRYTADEPRDLGFSGSEGALLIYGEDDGAAWFLTRPQPAEDGHQAGCYLMPANGVYDDETHLIFTIAADEGIRLPKADGVVLPPLDDPETGRYPSSSGYNYCLSEDGTVVSTDLPQAHE